MKFIIRTILLFFVCFVNSFANVTTTGGVTWLDTTGNKPFFYPISVPDENTVTNKYYINFSSGSGTTCSSGSPCNSFASLSGKAGTTGGPAIVYVKGNSTQISFPANFYGSAGNEILITPWPGDSTATEITAAAGCGTANAIIFPKSATIHHLIVDGGPSSLIHFNGSGCSGNQNGYTLAINTDNSVFVRFRIDAKDSGGPALGIGTVDFVNSVFIANMELYNANEYYGVYTGGGSNCPGGSSGHNDISIVNSIIRQVDGRGIQIEPRAASANFLVEGNLFHDVGYNNSAVSSAKGISCAVQPAGSCGASTSGIIIRNNVGYDLGGGFACLYDTGIVVRNNTVWNYGNKSPISLNSHGITSYSDGDPGTVEGNIILAPTQAGVNPLNRYSGWTSSKNICESGSSCASSPISGTPTSVFVTTTTTSVDFLKPKSGGPEENAGTNFYSSGITKDFLNNARPSSGSFEIGAMEIAAAGGDTTPPTVSVTAPTASSTVSGSSVTISATASDNIGVVGVQFKIDGTNTGSEDTSSPYSITWNSTSVSDGSHTITAVARDAAANSTTSSGVSITVDNTAPILSALGPSGATSGTSVTLSVTTNENATCKYSTSSGTAFGSKTSMTTTGSTSHSSSFSVVNGKVYHIYFACQDSQSNLSSDSISSFYISPTAKLNKNPFFYWG